MGGTYRLLWDLAKNPKMTNAHYRVYALIHAHCMGKDTCWPSINTLCGLAGVKRSRVFVLLKDLEGWGYIRREPRKGRSSIFHILDHTNKTTTEAVSEPVQSGDPGPLSGPVQSGDPGPLSGPVQSGDPGPLSGPVQSGDPGPLSGPAQPKSHSQNKEPQPPASEPVQLETPGKNEEKVDPSSQGTRVLSVDLPGAPEWTQKKSTLSTNTDKSTVRTSSSSTLNLKSVLVEKRGSRGKTRKPWVTSKPAESEEAVAAAIDAIDLDYYSKKFPDLSMDAEISNFRNWVFHKKHKKKNIPNWMCYKDWRNTFNNHCQRAADRVVAGLNGDSAKVVKGLRDYFKKRYEETKGEDYVAQGSTERALIRELLADTSPDEIKRRMDFFLNDDFSDWEQKYRPKHTIRAFTKHIDKFSGDGRVRLSDSNSSAIIRSPDDCPPPFKLND